MINKDKRKSEKEKGIALLMVITAVAILSILVVDLIYLTHLDVEISSNFRDELKAHYIAKSGVYVIAGALRTEKLEEKTELVALAPVDPSGNQEDELSQGLWSLQIPLLPFGDGTVSLTMVDERAKINLNKLLFEETNQPDEQVYMMLSELFGMLGVDANKSEVFLASLINWLNSPIRGPENDQYPGGADARFYENLDNPYTIKDGPLDSFEEIRLVHGMDDEFFDRVKNYLTIYTDDKKVNFSTAPAVVMRAVIKGATVPPTASQSGVQNTTISDDLAEAIANGVIEARSENPAVNIQTVRTVIKDEVGTSVRLPGLNDLVLSPGESDTFLVTSTGMVGEDEPTVKTIKTVIERNLSDKSSRIMSWREE